MDARTEVERVRSGGLVGFWESRPREGEGKGRERGFAEELSGDLLREMI